MKNNFDIKAYLTSRDIKIKTGGKNVTRGWIELIENCNYEQARKIAREFPLDITNESPWEDPAPPKRTWQSLLPENEIEKTWPQIHLDYLRSRGFEPHSLIKKYHLHPVWQLGQYRFRVIIPIIINRQIVSFTGMDILRQDKRPPYLDCPPERAIIPVKHCIYNIDTVKDKMLMFEGCTGVWRFGDESVASFTSHLTKEQIAMIARKKIRRAFVLFDPDAESKGKDMATQLSGIIPYVEQISFKEGDPKDMNPDTIRKLKKDIGF